MAPGTHGPVAPIFPRDSLAGNDAVILTKVDSDARGGAALSVAYTIGKPLLFIGPGQGYDDQIPFDADWMVERLFCAER